MPSPRPGKPSRLRGRGLHRDAPGLHPQQRRQPGDHGRRVRGDLWLLADQRDIRIRQPPASGRGSAPPRARRNRAAVGVLPLRILAWREMPANVALRQRAVDRIAQRVDTHVSVRVPRKPLLAAAPPPHKAPACPPGLPCTCTSYPVPVRGSNSWPSSARSSRTSILRITVSLILSSVPRTTSHGRQASPLQQGRRHRWRRRCTRVLTVEREQCRDSGRPAGSALGYRPSRGTVLGDLPRPRHA